MVHILDLSILFWVLFCFYLSIYFVFNWIWGGICHFCKGWFNERHIHKFSCFWEGNILDDLNFNDFSFSPDLAAFWIYSVVFIIVAAVEIIFAIFFLFGLVHMLQILHICFLEQIIFLAIVAPFAIWDILFYFS